MSAENRHVIPLDQNSNLFNTLAGWADANLLGLKGSDDLVDEGRIAWDINDTRAPESVSAEFLLRGTVKKSVFLGTLLEKRFSMPSGPVLGAKNSSQIYTKEVQGAVAGLIDEYLEETPKAA